MNRRAAEILFAVMLLASAPLHAAAVGEAAPAVYLPDADGRTVSLADLRGTVVYVDSWASWCGPCKRSFPWMNEMLRKYGAKGLAVIAVNVDKKREDALRFLQSTPASVTVVYDPDGKVPQAWQVKGMPSSYLVDARGRIVLAETGFRDERKSELEERIRAALEMR
jgi:thiol-disulfide isomerase/thioredoxin